MWLTAAHAQPSIFSIQANNDACVTDNDCTYNRRVGGGEGGGSALVQHLAYLLWTLHATWQSPQVLPTPATQPVWG